VVIKDKISARKRTDSKEINGLAMMVQSQLQLDPFSKALFLFCARRCDHINGLLLEGYGFLLRFIWRLRISTHFFTILLKKSPQADLRTLVYSLSSFLILKINLNIPETIFGLLTTTTFINKPPIE